jgi:hypothetical protein
VAGVYLGEDATNWPHFFATYISFLKSENGIRGECSKSVRTQLTTNPHHFDHLLGLLGLNHQSHIHDIYVKFKQFSPNKQYDSYLKVHLELGKV